MECIDGRMIESLETQRHPIAGRRRPAIKGLQDEEFRNSAPIGKALIQEVSKANDAQGGKGCIIEYSCAFDRSEEHTSELQSLMSNSYAISCFKKKHDRDKLL